MGPFRSASQRVGDIVARDGGEPPSHSCPLALETNVDKETNSIQQHAYFYIRCSLDDITPGHDNSFWCVLEAIAIRVEQEFRFRALHQHFDESYEGQVGRAR